MDEKMIKELELWLSKNFCPIIETTGTVVCRLLYKSMTVKRHIAIAFTRYHHGDDPAEYVIADVGYVLTVPSFWLSIPKELVIPYLCSYIDGYISEYITGTGNGGNTGGNNGGNTGTGCPNKPHHKPDCPIKPSRPPKPPMPPIMPPNNCDDCDNPSANGYFIQQTPSNNMGSFNNIVRNNQGE